MSRTSHAILCRRPACHTVSPSFAVRIPIRLWTQRMRQSSRRTDCQTQIHVKTVNLLFTQTCMQRRGTGMKGKESVCRVCNPLTSCPFSPLLPLHVYTNVCVMLAQYVTLLILRLSLSSSSSSRKDTPCGCAKEQCILSFHPPLFAVHGMDCVCLFFWHAFLCTTAIDRLLMDASSKDLRHTHTHPVHDV